MKVCTKCKIEKSEIEFTRDKTKRDGFYSSCKTCNPRGDYFKNRVSKKSEYDRAYYANNREAILARVKEYYELNRPSIFKYYRERPHKDIGFRLKKRIRSRVYKALKTGKKPKSVMKSLGCTLEDLKLHIASKFQDGMSFKNYGAWHVDHIVPLAKFDLTKIDEFQKACHFTNLQPLWAKDNQRKSAK